MPSRKLSHVITFYLASAVLGCGDDTTDTASTTSSDAGTGSACTTLTYAEFGQPFMTEYCASCHAASVTGTARKGAPTNDVFDTVTQIRNAKSELLKEVVTMKSMPPSGSAQPSTSERTLLAEWLNCDAP